MADQIGAKRSADVPGEGEPSPKSPAADRREDDGDAHFGDRLKKLEDKVNEECSRRKERTDGLLDDMEAVQQDVAKLTRKVNFHTEQLAAVEAATNERKCTVIGAPRLEYAQMPQVEQEFWSFLNTRVKGVVGVDVARVPWQVRFSSRPALTAALRDLATETGTPAAAPRFTWGSLRLQLVRAEGMGTAIPRQSMQALMTFLSEAMDLKAAKKDWTRRAIYVGAQPVAVADLDWDGQEVVLHVQSRLLEGMSQGARVQEAAKRIPDHWEIVVRSGTDDQVAMAAAGVGTHGAPRKGAGRGKGGGKGGQGGKSGKGRGGAGGAGGCGGGASGFAFGAIGGA
eukprot:CAMPEP_0170284302 /NCGR_PEP_ID=MMETSP0116_2-20130129/42188_1 /TAXON_ID=400756 /ORGANISM="Durinskia baltica, Strain CSIRO CS-38" /LENGTH=339 /DNA_ID=CAMNT_0010535679 /DNA_START=46 /DNA_END=1062 /DNA_ORIENTATION=-